MLDTISHIKNATASGMMAVWKDGQENGARLEVGRGLSGYSVFRYYGFRLMEHHHGLTLKESASVVNRWIAERAD